MADEALALLDLRDAERVLDVGCGNGKITAEIAARMPQGSVVGVDASADMVHFAGSHFGSSTLRFQVADARSLPFREEFDLVVSFNALHWVPDQDHALLSIWQALKSPGSAQLRLVPDGKRKSLETVIEETRLSPRWADYFRDFQDPYLHLSPEEYAKLAQQCGFRLESLGIQDKSWDFGSREAFIAFGTVTFVAWTQRLPENEKLPFVIDVLDRYRKVAADRPSEENTFKFYQMDIRLKRD